MATSAPRSWSPRRGAKFALRAVTELAIIAALYFAYRFGRLIGLGREDVAHAHAELVHHAERFLHLPSEAAIQSAVSHIPDIYELANRYYVTLHFPVIVAFLLWGFFARPRPQYIWARNLLIVQTSLALVIHIAFPLAPPRMFPQWGFVDTMQVFGPNAYAGANASVANQFAAMPSLHIGWAVLIAVVLVRTAPRPVAALSVAHAALTVFVVVITANHWLLDGIVAASLLGVGLILFPGPGRHRFHATRLPARLVSAGRRRVLRHGSTQIHEPTGAMVSRYQLREDDGNVIGEESFDSFESANVWALEQDVKPGWTLYQQIAGEWTAARFDPS